MRERIKPLVQGFVRASSVPVKEDELAATLLHAYEIPEANTLAVVGELESEGLINRRDGLVWKIKKEPNPDF